MSNNPTRDDLQQAFLAHRRARGKDETVKILTPFGYDADLDGIPAERWQEAIAALVADVPATPKSDYNFEGEPLDPDRIYAVWNSAKRKP